MGDDEKPGHDWIHECNWALRNGLVPSHDVWLAVGKRIKQTAYKDQPVWGLLAAKQVYGRNEVVTVAPRGRMMTRPVMETYNPLVANPQFFYKDDIVATGLTYEEAMGLKKLMESNY